MSFLENIEYLEDRCRYIKGLEFKGPGMFTRANKSILQGRDVLIKDETGNAMEVYNEYVQKIDADGAKDGEVFKIETDDIHALYNYTVRALELPLKNGSVLKNRLDTCQDGHSRLLSELARLELLSTSLDNDLEYANSSPLGLPFETAAQAIKYLELI